MVYVNERYCTGCAACVEVCLPGAIRVVDGVAHIEQAVCDECQACVAACPNSAILVLQEPAGQPIALRRPAPISEPVERSRLWPVLGAALAFVGQEIVPRLAWALVEAWDKRRASVVSNVADRQAGLSRQAGLPRQAGRRRRRRGGRPA